MAVSDVIVGTPGSGGRAVSVNGVVLPSGMGDDLGVEGWSWVLKANLFGFYSPTLRTLHQRPQMEEIVWKRIAEEIQTQSLSPSSHGPAEHAVRRERPQDPADTCYDTLGTQ